MSTAAPLRNAHDRLAPAAAVLSPEIVLVDPELAAVARALLPEDPWTRFATPRRASTPPRGEAPTSERGRRRSVGDLVAVAALGALCGVLAVSWLGSPDIVVDSVPVAADADPVDVPEAGVLPTAETTASSHRDPPVVARQPGADGDRPRTLVWSPVPASVGYEVAFFRGDEPMLLKRTTAPRLELRRTWRFEGRTRSLSAGMYRWYVWPLLRRQGELVRGEAVVQAVFTVSH